MKKEAEITVKATRAFFLPGRKDPVKAGEEVKLSAPVARQVIGTTRAIPVAGKSDKKGAGGAPE